MKRALQMIVRVAFGGLAALAVCAAAPADPAPPGSLTKLGDLAQARSNHTATLLPGGLVLIAGGGSPEAVLGSAELYDPRTGVTRAIASLRVARMSHSATLLPDGRVLIVGGFGSGARSARSAEIFDPATERFAAAGATLEPHGEGLVAVPLLDGRILFAGGDVSGVGRTPTASAELYDPRTGTFTRTGSMHVARRTYGVIRLLDGRVLVAGGTTTDKQVVASAELYDPATGRFELTGPLRTARHKHAAALLPGGRVLVMGGSTGGDSHTLTSVERYDPRTGRFGPAPPLRAARYKFSALALRGGSVLAVGGANDLAEVTRSGPGGFHLVPGGGDSPRAYPAVVALADGSVLISGGYAAGGAKRSVWRYRP